MGDGTPLNLHLAARHAVEARGKNRDAGITLKGPAAEYPALSAVWNAEIC